MLAKFFIVEGKQRGTNLARLLSYALGAEGREFESLRPDQFEWLGGSSCRCGGVLRYAQDDGERQTKAFKSAGKSSRQSLLAERPS